MGSEDGVPVKDPLPGPGRDAGTTPGCQPTVQPRLEEARAVLACASSLGAGQAGPCEQRGCRQASWGNLSQPDPAWRVRHFHLSLHSQGNWLLWVEAGPRYQGPEDAALNSREKLTREWGVAWRRPWQGPWVRLAWGGLERPGLKRKPQPGL